MAPSASPYDIDVAACRARQRRVLAVMERLRLALVIVTQNQHVQYLVGPRYELTFSPAAALSADTEDLEENYAKPGKSAS